MDQYQFYMQLQFFANLQLHSVVELDSPPPQKIAIFEREVESIKMWYSERGRSNYYTTTPFKLKTSIFLSLVWLTLKICSNHI